MKFSCHCHYVILLDIATVHYVILCDRMIPYALYAQMVFIMLNEILLELLMILLILMKLIVLNSLNRLLYVIWR